MLGWELPPHNSGGLGVASYYMARALADKGVSIDFVLPYSAFHPNTEWMTVRGVQTVEPENRPTSQLAYSRAFGEMRELQSAYIEYVDHLVQTHTYDAVHAHDWLTMEAGVHAKISHGLPLVVHVHATEFDRSGSDQGNPMIHEIEYQGLLMADRIIAVSEITKALIVQKYHIPADKIEVAYNALSPDSFTQVTTQAFSYPYLARLQEEGYTVISSLGRLTIQKGLTQLVQALARASERYDRLVLLLAGDGEQRDELLALAADLGVADKVFFTGFVRGQQRRDAFSCGDIFVMSSVSEPFGITALEAAHHDTALIISKQSGVGEVLSSVLRYDFWDVDRLADQLVAVATSPALSSSLRYNVSHEYLRLSWHDVADICVRLYNELRHPMPQEVAA